MRKPRHLLGIEQQFAEYALYRTTTASEAKFKTEASQREGLFPRELAL